MEIGLGGCCHWSASGLCSDVERCLTRIRVVYGRRIGVFKLTHPAVVCSNLAAVHDAGVRRLPARILAARSRLAGLIGLTTVLAIPESSASTEDILAIVASIASVALGVLCGVELHAWLTIAGIRVRRAGRRGV